MSSFEKILRNLCFLDRSKSRGKSGASPPPNLSQILDPFIVAEDFRKKGGNSVLQSPCVDHKVSIFYGLQNELVGCFWLFCPKILGDGGDIRMIVLLENECSLCGGELLLKKELLALSGQWGCKNFEHVPSRFRQQARNRPSDNSNSASPSSGKPLCLQM